MENKQSSSRKKLLTNQVEKQIRKLDYDPLANASARLSKTGLLLDLEILQRKAAHRPASQRVVVSIKQRVPTIKTIYIAEKNRYLSLKSSEKTGSRLALGDHLSSTHFSDTQIHLVSSVACGPDHPISDSYETEEVTSDTNHDESTECVSEYLELEYEPRKFNIFNTNKRSIEKCYLYTQQNQRMDVSKNTNKDKKSSDSNKFDIATFIVTNKSSEKIPNKPSNTKIHVLEKRINHLEQKLFKQEMVIRSLDPNATLSSTDEECKVNNNLSKSAPATSQAGCSYIPAMYSHLTEVSAFQRYAHQVAPLSPSKATTIEKDHNSEQYGRNFVAYDGITTRGRRQCASVPCKRDDAPKLAAERVYRIRHRLNPVHDYRLMDTVHYLAQGEFAPRDDGIKLTPSREAVLSDIIYEDVCRTHWPNARLGRRHAQNQDRCNSRGELQRLIDSLLRERIAHVERRRRRHYRVVKLSHRHENSRSVGKTGDIIVASHKNKHGEDNATTSALMCDKRREESETRRTLRSRDRVISEMQQYQHLVEHKFDDSMPGPSNLANRCSRKEPTHLYQASSPAKPLQPTRTSEARRELHREVSNSSSTCKPKYPRLVIKRDASRKYNTRDEPDLKHYILLPTLVVRTPSNMKRQKKFNELYHRILNVHINKGKVNNDACNENKEPRHSPNLKNKLHDELSK